MGNSHGVKAELSFKDIFPKLKDYYDSLFYNMRTGPVSSGLYGPCNNINNRFKPSANTWNSFYQPCVKLGLYLHELKNRKEDTRKPYCNFYIYELKREAMNKAPNIKSYDDLHNQLINAYKNVSVGIPDVCKEYVSFMNDDVYNIFAMFKELYDHYNKFQRDSNNCEYVKKCAEKYKEFSHKVKYDYKNIVQEELDEFKLKFHKLLEQQPNCKNTSELLNSSLGKVDASATRSEALLGHIESPVTWTSTGFLFFAILVIMFILYNYTAYGSYLRPRRRMLKNIRNRKYKKHYELMKLYEQLQKNVIQNKHSISYNSVE
ncbi:variable surface protein [Plasmodium gonderi]|uniref:Variable surface protein n=1 Tax=Plasmodium gonderi TaxID=77519 RepID=A0A1Y1JXG3_PLAGO|nr:variable surface protein [Plasmodium gonderi]GAW84494.1 variable surface protein [Plasmodium gonderi]